MRGRRKTAKISEAEWNIMKVLWKGSEELGRGMTLGEIVDKLSDETGWSDTTIRTLIIRLSEKGAVSIDKTTGVYKYKPVPSEEESVKAEISSFINRVFGGNPLKLMLTLAKNVQFTPEERQEIISALK